MSKCPKCGWTLTWLDDAWWCGDCDWTGSEAVRAAPQTSTPVEHCPADDLVDGWHGKDQPACTCYDRRDRCRMSVVRSVWRALWEEVRATWYLICPSRGQ